MGQPQKSTLESLFSGESLSYRGTNSLVSGHRPFCQFSLSTTLLVCLPVCWSEGPWQHPRKGLFGLLSGQGPPDTGMILGLEDPKHVTVGSLGRE